MPTEAREAQKEGFYPEALPVITAPAMLHGEHSLPGTFLSIIYTSIRSLLLVDKKTELASLAAEMVADRALPLTGQANLVFGEGDPDCAALFIGEAPGENEDRECRPFVGRGGQLLRKNIRDIGWKEDDVYITNIVKRRPPGNRDPLPEEIESYKPYLTRQISIIAPKVIVPLGRFAMNYFLPEAKISRDHGKIFRLPCSFGGSSERGETVLIVPFFHPAAALRATEVLKTFENDFKSLPKIVDGGGVGIELPPAYAETSSSKDGLADGKQQPRLF